MLEAKKQLRHAAQEIQARNRQLFSDATLALEAAEKSAQTRLALRDEVTGLLESTLKAGHAETSYRFTGDAKQRDAAH